MEYYEEKIFSSIEKLYETMKTKYSIFKITYSLLSWNSTVEFIKLKARTWVQTVLESGFLSHPRGSFCDLVYYDGTSRYVVRFPKTRGPGKVSMVFAENQEDVTSKIRSYMGPCHNFHGIVTTPSFLGYKNLLFSLRDGRKILFEEDEPISIK